MTFCNQNRVNCARLTDQLEDQSDSHSANILQWIRTTVCSAAPSPPNGRKRRQAPAPGGQLGQMGPTGDTPDYLETEYTFLKQYMSLNRSIRSHIGHEFTSFIKSCTFRGKDCLNIRSSPHSLRLVLILFPFSNFEAQFSPRFGNCWSFNSNVSGTNENLWSSSLPGSVMGLNVVLNIEQFQYLHSGLTPSAGARVTIHDTVVRPLVDEYGLDVEPQKATNFAIAKVMLRISYILTTLGLTKQTHQIKIYISF